MIKSTVRALALFCFLAITSLPALANQTISADGLPSGWADWSWDSTINIASTAAKHSGTTSIAVTITAAWGALYLHSDAAIDLSSFTAIEFWVNGGSAGNQSLVLVADGSTQSYPFTATTGTWTKVSVPLSTLGSPGSLSDLYWQDAAGRNQSTFYLDDIVLVSGSGGSPTPPGAGPVLTVDANAGRHAISSGIYGMNYLDDVAFATELSLPVRRWGGNSTSRYNWQNDTTNTGSDWYFENIAQDNPNPATLPDGSSADRFVEQDRSTATRTLMTVPMMGWVAKRRLDNHPYDCGFKVSKYGAQQSTDSWDPDCGNGVLSNGTSITGNAPTDTSTTINAAFISGWVTHLVGKYGSAANGGVAYYDLDNEPSLWNSTHRDVHPQGNTYDEMRDKTYLFAAAVKSADPSAQTLGPVEWGWCGYYYSGADGCGAGADAAAHGSTPFVAWYLQQMKAYEQLHALRILDYLDLHYYPAANGVSLSSAGNAATQALRLRSTRSLWDPTYIDESWISDMQSGGIAVQMIPRMKQWVTDNYPGTRLAITEYNWGGLESINGALTQADVLGIFGREGLDLATLWGPPTTNQPGAFAFRMFRNYDGAGHLFGDMSVSATSGDQSQLAVYAAQRSSDNALTVMVINKTASALTSTLTLSNFSAPTTAAVYRYSPVNLNVIEHAADQAVSANALAATFPAQSITVFVLAPTAGGITPTTTRLTSAPNPSTAGQNITLTATVTGAGNAATGGVVFRDGNATLCTSVALANGNATCTTAALTTGQHALTAAYGGDSRNTGSTSNTVNQVVNAVSTNGQLNFSPTTCSVSEGQTTNCTLTVTRTGGSTGAVSVPWSTANGTALAGTDFGVAGSAAQKSGTLSWATGVSTAQSITVGLATANVPVINNAKVDGSRSFTINLGTPTGSAVLGLASSATVTIADNDSALDFALTSISVNENAGTVSLTVTRTGSATAATSVAWLAANGTALAGSSYGTAGSTVVPSGTLSWAAGDASSKTITIPILSIAGIQGNKSFTVTLASPAANAVLNAATKTVTVTIVDVTTNLSLAGSTTSINEDAGPLVLTVNRTGNASGAVTAHWTATNGTAIAGTDYGTAGSTVLPSGTLSWAAGDATAKTIAIPVFAIGTVGANRSFTVSLSAASGGATLVSPTSATVTIVDTSSVLQFSVATASVSESAGSLNLTVNRTGSLVKAASVNWSTTDGTAVSGTDFGTAGAPGSVAGTLSWAAGMGGAKTVTIPIINTGTLTGSKTFTVALAGPVGATLGRTGQVLATIQENDLNAYFSPTTYVVTDRVNPSIALSVKRAGTVTGSLAVTWTAVNGTARAGTDYGTAGSTTLPTGTLTWAANDATAKTVTMPILPVTTTTGGRAFQVVLSTTQAGVWLDPVTKLATVTINDDATATVSFDPAVPKRVVTEAPGAVATLNIVRSGSLGAGGTVNYSTVAGSAVAGTDYTARTNVAVPFAAGQSTATISIPIVNHTSAVPPRAFQVVLSAPSIGLGLGSPLQATVQILGTAEAFPAHGQWPSGWVVPQINGSPGYGWQVSNDPGAAEGYYCLKSDSIFDGEAAQVQIPDAGYLAGNVSFKYRVSSEPGFDFLRFYMDSTKLGEWSGAANATTWGTATFAVPAGHHTFTWSYEKDASVSVGNDTAWIDAVTLPAPGP